MTDPLDTAAQPPTTRGTWRDVLGWGAYLGASWTWCIGMFLPVLLIRDFGYASFFVFAVPNVLGAALMGVFLRRPGASERMVREHGEGCRAFSIITITFQCFFLFWAADVGNVQLGYRFWCAVLLAFVIFGHGPRWALFVLMVSAVCGGAWLASHPPLTYSAPPQLPRGDLLWMVPVCTLGFGLCPYLDLTFHHARQKLSGHRGSMAFILGFGVFFLAMILLTFMYAGQVLGASDSAAVGVTPSLLAIPLLIHIGVQLTFTGNAHDRLADPSTTWTTRRHLRKMLPVFVGMFLANVPMHITYHGLSAPEVIYRLFMSFYGLIFPAYVWICILGRGRPTRASLVPFAAAVVIAAPMFWMGFIERHTWWLGPGVLVILVARLFARNSPTPAAAD